MLNERIKELVVSKGVTPYRIHKDLGISQSSIKNYLDGITEPNASILKHLANYFEVNYDWLLTGTGEKNINLASKYSSGFPLIPVTAIAGFPNGDSQVNPYDIQEHYYIPEFDQKGVKFLIRASGSSMYPKYSNGDLLACKPINDLSFFQWGKVYVLDTDQGPLVKRLFPCKENEDFIECHSDNKANYPPFKIHKTSIRKVSIVVGVIRLE